MNTDHSSQLILRDIFLRNRRARSDTDWSIAYPRLRSTNLTNFRLRPTKERSEILRYPNETSKDGEDLLGACGQRLMLEAFCRFSQVVGRDAVMIPTIGEPRLVKQLPIRNDPLIIASLSGCVDLYQDVLQTINV